MPESALVNKAESYLKEIANDCISLENIEEFDVFKDLYFKLDNRLNYLSKLKDDMDVQGYITIKYTDVGMDEDEVIEDVPVGKPIGSKLDGHERYREGYRFLGYSKMQNADKPDFFKKSIVTNNLVSQNENHLTI